MKIFKGYLLGFLAFVLPLGLYIKTLASTYIPIDSAELALCMNFWGICHPPGFPLYILVGKIFTGIFPFGTLIFKANLLSAIFGAGTVLLVYLSLVELKIDKRIAFLLSLFLAVSAAFWEFSISADVFTFAAFLISLTFFLVFKNRSPQSKDSGSLFLAQNSLDPRPEGRSFFARNRPLWAFLALGLSASHFYISAILFPLLVWYFWPLISPPMSQSPHRRWLVSGKILKFIFFFALGFFPQVLMYLRMQQSPEINWGHAKGISGFLYFVRRSEFGSIFLLSNPVLKFTLLKVFKHFNLYFANLLFSFGVILPVITLIGAIFAKFYKNRRLTFITFSFFTIVAVQLVLLSTIDPSGEDNPFQINKFYLSSFVLFVFLSGAALDWIVKRLFGEESMYALFLLATFILIYLTANFRVNNYANNYFSQRMVEDALSQLPQGSVAMTVSHIVYFGGLYEQKINGNFAGVTLLYFPNEKNRDGEKYHPELFKKPTDSDFVKDIEKGKSLGTAEKYVLSVIAKNLDRDIFILQGTFEEGFFAYLKPYIVPYGLWWRVSDPYAEADSEKSLRLLSSLQNADVKFADLHLKQQQLDSLTYAVAYHSTGIVLAAGGEYDLAVDFLNKSYEVRPKGDNVQKELELIGKTKQLAADQSKLVESRDKIKLTELGNNLFTLGNFARCSEVFEELSKIDDKDAHSYNNLASCQASLGKKQEARQNYQKALEIDPNLDMAKKGLEALED